MKNFKKLAAVLAAGILCAGTAFISFAGDSTDNSQEIPVIGEEGSPVSIQGNAVDKDGNEIAVYTAPITDEEFNDTLKDPEAVKDVLTNAGFAVPDGVDIEVLDGEDAPAAR